MAHISTVEAAKEIRTALKALGITSKRVGVRSELYSMGSTIHVTIKDPTVKKSVVEGVASAYRIVYRDDATGEILGGGNRFVDVEYSSDALRGLRDVVKAQWESGRFAFGSWQVRQLDQWDFRAENRSENRLSLRCWGLDNLARSLVIELIEGEELDCLKVAA